MMESDLPAADARYHSACRTNFMYNFKKEGNKAPEDPPFLLILCSGLKGRRPFWLLNPPSRGGGGVLACCCLGFPFLEMRRWSSRR